MNVFSFSKIVRDAFAKSIATCFTLAAIGTIGFAPIHVLAQVTSEVRTFSGLDASTDTVYVDLASKKITAAEAKWDLAFKGTTILVNGSGQIVEKAFQKMTEAPADGYNVDKPGSPAIPVSNDDGWFDYDPNSHIVSPLPFKTLVFKLASGGYAKLEIVDYYTPDGTPRSYTFRYALSENGKF